VEPVNIDGKKHLVLALNDISERKEAERELKATMEMKSQFIATVSHELRTPLTSIREAISILLDEVAGKINKDQRHFLDIGKRNIDRLSRLINDVLDFQKLRANKMEFQIAEHDIRKTIEEACNTMSAFAEKNGVHLSTCFDPAATHVDYDSDRIIQVLTNLISNAIKFTPQGGQVSVCTERRPEHVGIQICDTGLGIPKEALPKIFDRFYRVHRPGKEITGTGLGLAIVNKIVTGHGGRVEVESKVDRGTTFTVVLPLNQNRLVVEGAERADEQLEGTLARDCPRLSDC
jgi:signal transduction histidine kinase